jgi:hypothetical protein
MLAAGPQANSQGATMTLCPIAVVAGCRKCPAFSICPLKTVIGDAPKPPPDKSAAPTEK